jgi:hypothetical protein
MTVYRSASTGICLRHAGFALTPATAAAVAELC